MPKAYLVAEMTITDTEKYERYRKGVLATLESAGGRFLVRGGRRVQMEGTDDAHHDQVRTVVVEFPSMEAALAWYESPAYTPLKELRMSASDGRLFFVEGS
jgi:uncharacterized protein (DUF1330 family)